DPGQPYGQQQAPYGQQAYGQPAYPPAPYGQQGGYYGAPAGGQTDGLAIGAMIAGIASIALCWGYGIGLLAGAAGGIIGFVCKKNIEQSGGVKSGGSMATAGIICGFLGAALSLVQVLLIIVDVSWRIMSSRRGPERDAAPIRPPVGAALVWVRGRR